MKLNEDVSSCVRGTTIGSLRYSGFGIQPCFGICRVCRRLACRRRCGISGLVFEHYFSTTATTTTAKSNALNVPGILTHFIAYALHGHRTRLPPSVIFYRSSFLSMHSDVRKGIRDT